jgi:hypothetical protein
MSNNQDILQSKKVIDFSSTTIRKLLCDNDNNNDNNDHHSFKMYSSSNAIIDKPKALFASLKLSLDHVDVLQFERIVSSVPVKY